MQYYETDLLKLKDATEIWGFKPIAVALEIDPADLRRWLKADRLPFALSETQAKILANEFFPPPYNKRGELFDFVDIFAGIGGIRRGFDEIGGRCVLTAEWDDYARRTYRANYPEPEGHMWIKDIKEFTQIDGVDEEEQLEYIESTLPDHEVLIAGFPCQPFSIAGVSKKNALGRSHGFDCEDQGQLFFDVLRILKAKKTPFAVLENVKNLKSHDRGNTFKVITSELKKAGYWIADISSDNPDPKIVDGADWVPQHRERVILVCVRNDIAHELMMQQKFSLKNTI